jgi:hypothetical protein
VLAAVQTLTSAFGRTTPWQLIAGVLIVGGFAAIFWVGSAYGLPDDEAGIGKASNSSPSTGGVTTSPAGISFKANGFWNCRK